MIYAFHATFPIKHQATVVARVNTRVLSISADELRSYAGESVISKIEEISKFRNACNRKAEERTLEDVQVNYLDSAGTYTN